MPKKIDMEFAEFELCSSMMKSSAEPDHHLSSTSVTIKTFLSSDEEETDDLVDVAKVDLLALHNYKHRSDNIHLFDCFDAHSQLACNSFEYVNFADGQNDIIEKHFRKHHPIALVMNMDIKQDFHGQEEQIVSLMVEAIRRQFGENTFCFGLAPQLMTYKQEEPKNEKDILDALGKNGFKTKLESADMPSIENAKPFFAVL